MKVSPLFVFAVSVLLCWHCSSGQQRGLFPAVLNLASMADITSNATCGQNGSEMYCKLVEHVPGRPFRNPQCRICDLNSRNPKERHEISNAIDGTNRWWQSPSIQNGMEYHYVTITLDLKQVFQIAYVIVKAANSPRPGNWILERSIDGIIYKPWQYYAITDTECLTRYNIVPRPGNPTYTSDDEIICTSFYSKIQPLENGEIHTSLINGRPSAEDPSPTLLEFTSARYIRLRLERIRTLNADLMTLAYNDPKDIDPIVTRRYYYSLKDISVGGMCICYGHASACPLDLVTNKFSCKCEHNTCGESCDRCCPGFHQKPWAAGTFYSSTLCEQCNCHGKAKDCYYDENVANRSQSLNIKGEYIGGGVCIDCVNKTTGINCETCIDEYFRPEWVSPYEPNPCIPCFCNLIGSFHNKCIKDIKHIEGGLLPGSCHCKAGYGGDKCDRCAFGFTGYPDCVPCTCNIDGSLNADPCVEPCVCKANTEGENCAQCKTGFFNLRSENYYGCERCFCSGVSSVCESCQWRYDNVTDMFGWFLTDLEGISNILPRQEFLVRQQQVIINEDKDRRVLSWQYYWSAPSAYLARKLTAYGGKLIFTISADSTGHLSHNQKSQVILEGNGILISNGADGIKLDPLTEHTKMIVLRPENFVIHSTMSPVNRKDFMTVLANVTRLLIRATYNYDQTAIYGLSSVILQTANPNSLGQQTATSVEICHCPPEYSGTSCESCAQGYRWVNGTLYGGICVPCSCYGHSSYCDDITGECLNCQHDTTGRFCDKCRPGFYGDPTRGTPNDCHPCSCPLLISTNNFSPTCHLDSRGETICDQCAPGYAGSRCDRCSEGFFGRPNKPGGLCQPCQCNYNLDLSVPGSCNSLTGECLRCIEGVSGQFCDQCAAGFFGDAVVARNCRPCDCHVNGSVAELCDKQTGQCQCKHNVVGRQCDHCLPNCWWDHEKKVCMPCLCSPIGSMSLRCDQTGTCICKPGFLGKHCALNRQLYEQQYDEGSEVAKPIQIQRRRWWETGIGGCPRGAYKPATASTRGSETYYLHSSRGCIPCNCNSFGSKSFDCDDKGQCRCQPGVAGQKCDRCALGFYHFQEGGCIPCECAHVGNHCDSETGQCRCPPNTVGEKCDKCAANFWGHNFVSGCKPCNCSVVGSLNLQCDDATGCCFCRPEFTGEKCDRCRVGYWNYPLCRHCDCDLAGTERQTCDEAGICSCAEYSGQCNCKVNVEGISCDRCKTDAFTLSSNNPHGCSNCYCSGVTTQCTEAKGLIRKRLMLNPDQTVLKIVNKFNDRETTDGVFHQHPEIVANVDVVIKHLLYEPFYWRLPEQFEGEKLKAYGGKLRYAIYFEAREEVGQSTYEPQIIMRGGPTGELTIVRHVSAPQIGQLTRHEVELTEHDWKYDNSPDGRPVSRKDFMDLLYDVNSILIKASYGTFMRQTRISEISMEVAEASDRYVHAEQAQQIEQCFCPEGYSGLSCQDCMLGYYRVPSRSTIREHRPVTWSCVQCQCNGHSDICDSKTSVCQNCRDNTAGAHCEVCAPGYYGIVRGSPNDCRPCACPLQISSNNFSPTCVIEGHNAYRCDACKEGYEGLHCERCAPGYYGNPRIEGNACIQSCDDECTGLLLNDLEQLNQLITRLNLSGPLPPPYKVLYRYENISQELKYLMSPQRAPERLLQLADSNLDTLITEMDELLNRTTKVSADGEQTDKDTEKTDKRAKELEKSIRYTMLATQDLKEKAKKLNDTLRIKDGVTDRNLQHIHQDIEKMIAEMRGRSFDKHEEMVEDELDAARVLLERVKKLFDNPHKNTQGLKDEVQKKLADYKNKFDEAQELLKEAQEKIKETNHLSAVNQRNMTVLEMRKQAVEGGKKDTEDVLNEGHYLIAEAKQLLGEISLGLDELEEQEHLEPLIAELKDKMDELAAGIHDEKLPDLVLRAEYHAAVLNDSSGILDGILAEAKNLSFNATAAFRAYTNIKDKIDEAEKVAKEAKETANQAVRLASGPDGSLKETAKSSLQRSFRQLNEGKRLGTDVKEKRDNLNNLENRLNDGTTKNKNLLKALNDTLAKLHAIPKDASAKIQAAKEKAKQANDTANAVLAEIKDLNQNLLGLQDNCSKLKDDVAKANAAINIPAKTIADADMKVKELEDKTDKLMDKLKPIKNLQDTLGRNISHIKDLINQARKHANSIKVSVSSGGDCIRTYRPDIKKGTYNSIVLNVKTSELENLLFYLGSARYTDFLAIEMRKGKVNFLWDVGSGVGRVEYPDLVINDQYWYRIEASRFRRNGTISVRALDGPRASIVPTTHSAVSPEGYTILDVDENAYLFVGGLTGEVKKSDVVKTTTFSGCMGETSLDRKPIGLWNYRDRQGECKGCVVSPQPTDTEGTVQFDGEGYAAVGRPTRWNPNVSAIAFKFRTFTADALLMYLATKDLKDFMSVELTNGRIKVSYDLGSGAANITSKGRYNDGKWKSFTLSRILKQANISIRDVLNNKEESFIVISPGTNFGLNLKANEKIYFGGLPILKNLRPEVSLKKYSGCLRDIEISQSPYNLLSGTDYLGLTKGCSLENVHTVSFHKPGFVELQPHALNVGTEISFSFSTKNETGMILYGSGKAPAQLKRKRRQTGQVYYAVFLNRGRLEVHVAMGTREPRRVTIRPESGVFNDGKEHSVRLHRSRGYLTVQVNEEKAQRKSLPNDLPLDIKRLFVGGVPASFQVSQLRSITHFEGCIWNLVVNSIPLDFAQPVYFEHAEIGRCPTLKHPKPLIEDVEEIDTAEITIKPISEIKRIPTPAPNMCAPDIHPIALLGVKRFGLSKNSHVAIEFDDTKVKTRLIIEFEIQTEAESGLVFYMARINHADFATIQIKDGMAHFSYDLGSGNASTVVQKKINDGEWHKVRIVRDRKRVTVTIGLTVATAVSPKNADILDVVGMIYIGGLPKNYTTRRIGRVLYSINACIRNFKLNNKTLDLDNPTSSLDVGVCFLNSQRGNYFDGTGFAKTVARYRVGTDLRIEFDFRTSQRDAVLLGISSQRVDGLGIELVGGKIFVHIDNGAGIFTAVYDPLRFNALCQGQWHNVVVNKVKYSLELIVDGERVESRSPSVTSTATDTNDPVFVGGYPSDMKQLALTIDTPFKGCIRNLKLTKGTQTLEVDFSKAIELKGVQPLTCPA
ncbi:laminin subunit alpha-2 isoform X2 [Hemiscyllium ocellatum]|uniref:laminin subunit alpha-2 isoform X2 n=1 Tax=Hemiscyllium ocellatum TaxID=170820 RepID=UPI002965EA72|nr:laminin subunit alpha-2 isoform X2 [Hemiscyllium ocellatum]